MRAFQGKTALIAIAFLASAVARASYPNGLCRENGFESFIVACAPGIFYDKENCDGKDVIPPPEYYSAREQSERFVDLCQGDRWAIPLGGQRLVGELGKLNKEVAEVFGIPFNKLLPEGVRARLLPGMGGPAASGLAKAKRSLNLEFLRDGPVIVDHSVYLHEVAHLILHFSKHPDLAAIAPWTFFPMLDEAFADLVAIERNGDWMTPESGVAAPLYHSLRPVPSTETFSLPISYFRAHASQLALDDACTRANRAGGMNGESRAFCSWFSAGTKREEFKLEGASEAQPFTHEACFLQDPRKQSLPNEACDPHRLGVPWNAFLIATSKELGVPATRFFLDSLRQAAASGSLPQPRKFVCQVDEVPSLPKVLVEVPLSDDLLTALREYALPRIGPRYDELAQRFAIKEANDFLYGSWKWALIHEALDRLEIESSSIADKPIDACLRKPPIEALQNPVLREAVSTDFTCNIKCDALPAPQAPATQLPKP